MLAMTVKSSSGSGNGELSGWVKAVTALGSTGALIVIAGYLVYAMVEGDGIRAADLENIRIDLKTHTEQQQRSNLDLKVDPSTDLRQYRG